MTCPVCHQRKARRDCPALGQTICSVCCGSKRIVEIDCPPECVHLSTARAHPAAVVRRQHEADVAVLYPSVQPLTERQHQLFFLFHSAIARHQPEGFGRLVDADVAEAAAAVAATLETAAKGVIYEHSAPAATAQRLAVDLTALLHEIRAQGATVYDGEAALTLRAIEKGARTVGPVSGGGDTAYLELMGRLMQVNRAAPRPETAPPASSIILP